MSSRTPEPSAKRRRVDAASATLKKPFRSPLITRSTPTVSSLPLATSPQTPSRNGTRDGKLAFTPASSKPLARPAFLVPKTAESHGPSAQQHSTPAPEKDELLASMRKQQHEMNARLREVRDELALVREAERIEKQSQAIRPGQEVDAEMKQLVRKWKLASRQAAEDLFDIIKGRVADMGGAKAWRETRRRQQEYFRGDDDGSSASKTGGTTGDDDDADGRDAACPSHDGEASPCLAGGDEDDAGSSQDTTFTMLMMLQSLNIDPDMLGYVSAEDKWRD